jgi:excisionase family DNA binding protein
MLTESDLLFGPFSPAYFSVKFTARTLGVCELTVRRWLKNGVLEHQRFGRTIRIPREAVYRKRQAAEVVGKE